MTGIDIEEMDQNDRRASDAEKLAEEILTPHKVFKPKYGSQRRKSILNPVEERPLMDIASRPGSTDSVFSTR